MSEVECCCCWLWLELVCRRVSYHRTLAHRTKSPPVGDSDGDALMAAISVPVSQECSGGNLADMVSSLQQQVLALQSDRGSAGDIDVLGEARVKKGGGKGGNGVGGGSGTGVSGGINGSCWWCGVFGHRQSECTALDA